MKSRMPALCAWIEIITPKLKGIRICFYNYYLNLIAFHDCPCKYIFRNINTFTWIIQNVQSVLTFFCISSFLLNVALEFKIRTPTFWPLTARSVEIWSGIRLRPLIRFPGTHLFSKLWRGLLRCPHTRGICPQRDPWRECGDSGLEWNALAPRNRAGWSGRCDPPVTASRWSPRVSRPDERRRKLWVNTAVLWEE